MRRSIGLLFALPLALAGCNPIVVGRTAELTPRGKLGFDYSLQTLTIEPQHIEQTDRSTLDSTVGFMPDMKLGVHGGLGRCEIGAGFPVPSAFTELRCAVAQESRGAPVSVAFGGAAGVSLAQGVEGGRPTPLGRL